MVTIHQSTRSTLPRPCQIGKMPITRSGGGYDLPSAPPKPAPPVIPVPLHGIALNPTAAPGMPLIPGTSLPGSVMVPWAIPVETNCPQRRVPPVWHTSRQQNALLLMRNFPWEIIDNILKYVFSGLASPHGRLRIDAVPGWDTREKLVKWGSLPWPFVFWRDQPVPQPLPRADLRAIDLMYGDLTSAPDYYWYWSCMKHLVANNKLAFGKNRDAFIFLNHLSRAPGGTPQMPFPTLTWVRDIALRQKLPLPFTSLVLKELAKCPRVWVFRMMMCNRCHRQNQTKKFLKQFEQVNNRCNKIWPARPAHPAPPPGRLTTPQQYQDIPLDASGKPTAWCYLSIQQLSFRSCCGPNTRGRRGKSATFCSYMHASKLADVVLVSDTATSAAYISRP